MKPSDLYRRIWEKAYDEGEILLTFKTPVEQRRMRLNLYAGVQKYRKDPMLDPGFNSKLEELELVTSQDQTSFFIHIRHQTKNPLLQDVARQLDGLLDDPDP